MFDAKLALDQLTQSNNGISRIQIMIGARNLAQDEKNNSVMFKFPNSKYNYCKIQLDVASDTYNLILQKYIWTKCKMTKELVIDGVYADQLKQLFEENTGLYLSL